MTKNKKRKIQELDQPEMQTRPKKKPKLAHTEDLNLLSLPLDVVLSILQYLKPSELAAFYLASQNANALRYERILDENRHMPSYGKVLNRFTLAVDLDEFGSFNLGEMDDLLVCAHEQQIMLVPKYSQANLTRQVIDIEELLEELNLEYDESANQLLSCAVIDRNLYIIAAGHSFLYQPHHNMQYELLCELPSPLANAMIEKIIAIDDPGQVYILARPNENSSERQVWHHHIQNNQISKIAQTASTTKVLVNKSQKSLMEIWINDNHEVCIRLTKQISPGVWQNSSEHILQTLETSPHAEWQIKNAFIMNPQQCILLVHGSDRASKHVWRVIEIDTVEMQSKIIEDLCLDLSQANSVAYSADIRFINENSFFLIATLEPYDEKKLPEKILHFINRNNRWLHHELKMSAKQELGQSFICLRDDTVITIQQLNCMALLKWIMQQLQFTLKGTPFFLASTSPLVKLLQPKNIVGFLWHEANFGQQTKLMIQFTKACRVYKQHKHEVDAAEKFMQTINALIGSVSVLDLSTSYHALQDFLLNLQPSLLNEALSIFNAFLALTRQQLENLTQALPGLQMNIETVATARAIHAQFATMKDKLQQPSIDHDFAKQFVTNIGKDLTVLESEIKTHQHELQQLLQNQQNANNLNIIMRWKDAIYDNLLKMVTCTTLAAKLSNMAFSGKSISEIGNHISHLLEAESHIKSFWQRLILQNFPLQILPETQALFGQEDVKLFLNYFNLADRLEKKLGSNPHALYQTTTPRDEKGADDSMHSAPTSGMS